MKITKPIFIVGTGRNGSTLLHDILTRHSNVIWTPTIYDKRPFAVKEIQIFFKLINYPILSNLLRKKYPASEAYPLWNTFYRGFGNPVRDLTEDDLTPLAQKKMLKHWSYLLTPRRYRLILKITGWSRIGFLKKAFPDAKFIHLVRDGRAVSNSLLNVNFWDGWRGPTGWRHGLLPKEYQKEWRDFQYSFVALAAINWKILIEAIVQSSKNLRNENFLQIRYEDFVADKIGTYSNILEFCEIEFHPSHKKYLLSKTFNDMNYKWKNDLAPSQQQILNSVLEQFLQKLDYVM